ncbi:MAG: DUF4388 domain-containing protein [Myxococcota bacterium]
MSLVGSLEDLGLADILQIVSMARKSGQLELRSEAGEGRIFLEDGLIRAAVLKGEPEDLRGLVVASGALSEADFEVAAQRARNRGVPLAEELAACDGLSAERLDELRREHVERAVLSMFSWHSGEFSFEVREGVDERYAELLLSQGLNAQYLAMEATRLGDEGAELAEERVAAVEEALPGGDAGLMFSGEPTPEAAEPSRKSAAPEAAPEAKAAAASRPAPLIAIDPDLAVLEWLKAAVSGVFSRIHIFQRAESAIARVRQYLLRGDLPVVLVAAEPPDDVARAGGVRGLVRRLKSQAALMPVFVMRDEGGEDLSDLPEADGVLPRPLSRKVANPGRWNQLEDLAKTLREELSPWAANAGARPASQAARPAGTAPQSEPGATGQDGFAARLNRLKNMSARLRDPNVGGEILSVILEFAAESFARVAIFALRDGVAVGAAQVGLERAGGPGDDALRELQFPADEPEWFRQVIDSGVPLRAPPSGEGDRRLADRLGDGVPAEAFVAPIERGARAAALLYADNLPEDRPIGDTTVLEMALHEAGVALERAWLKRALVEAGGGPEQRSED